MGYTNEAFAQIQNTTGIPLTGVTLDHQYSDDRIQSKTWDRLAPGATTPMMTVGYNTGIFRVGWDHWRVRYTLPDGSSWTSEWHTATLSDDDEGTTKTFTVTGSTVTDFRDATMQLSMDAAPHYNAWAAIELRNELPVGASVVVTHRYSDDGSYEHRFAPVPARTTSDVDDAFFVYFNTGFLRTGSDHWTLTVELDIPPYDNAPASAFAPFTNATEGKGCMLKSSDNGKTHVFSLNGDGVTFGIASGACTDAWKTWNGYDTLGFLNVENAFATTISTLVLTHRYSGDTTWHQTRALIPPNETSPWMVVEFNTGFLRTGLDYWNVFVYLEDGTWYQNHTFDKECLLRTADAVVPSTFTVSSTTFTLGLTSGSCSDSMDDKGAFSPNAERDPHAPYDKNAFIGSHNAYANFAAGFWYAQQTGSIATQLGQGATTLLLDIWFNDDDIYLKHNDGSQYQPFGVKQKLSDALVAIRGYLTLQSRDPVTIVFEDGVDDAHQNLIKEAFVTSQTWDMVFNPDTHDVASKGWPTLAGFFELGQPIIVLTSKESSPDFAYQWSYMSENVYGDASLDPATWLEPRGGSQPLDQLGLCALNHFPSWTVRMANLPDLIARADDDNAKALLATMVDACHTRWGRYPNYINADFWEVPDGDMVAAIVDLNQKLRGTGPDVLRVQHGHAILTEIDHSRLLVGDWRRATHWVDQHLTEICPAIDPHRPGPAHQLVDAVNLTVVVSVLLTCTPGDDTIVQPWLQATTRELVRYFLDVESLLLDQEGSDATAGQLVGIPLFLLEAATSVRFGFTEHLRRCLPLATSPGGHDGLLLAALAGRPDAAAHLAERLEITLGDTAEGAPKSRLYDLTHEILYLLLVAPERIPVDACASRLEALAAATMPADADLGAELLAAYWALGGPVTETVLEAVGHLKAASGARPTDCRPGRDGECRCPGFKEQVHNQLTLVLGLGATLSTQGEILDAGACAARS